MKLEKISPSHYEELKEINLTYSGKYVKNIEDVEINNLPKLLDNISFSYKGIKFYVYGVLHALTGGTNQEYTKAVNETIANSEGLILAEKSMKNMYKGIDEEVDDYIQVSFKDAFLLTLSFLGTPYRLYKLIKLIFKEKLTKKDKFANKGNNTISNIGGSLGFHSIEPTRRRHLAGFLPPKEYLLKNLYRKEKNKEKMQRIFEKVINNVETRKNKGLLISEEIKSNYQKIIDKKYKLVFPDIDWYWLTLIEPYANIPCRSAHMIENAVLIANKNNSKTVSLFIGETHHTDIAWYVTRKENDYIDVLDKEVVTELNNLLEEKINETIITSNKYIKDNTIKSYIMYRYKKLEYLCAIALASILSLLHLCLYIYLIQMVVHYIGK